LRQGYVFLVAALQWQLSGAVPFVSLRLRVLKNGPTLQSPLFPHQRIIYWQRLLAKATFLSDGR